METSASALTYSTVPRCHAAVVVLGPKQGVDLVQKNHTRRRRPRCRKRPRHRPLALAHLAVPTPYARTHTGRGQRTPTKAAGGAMARTETHEALEQVGNSEWKKRAFKRGGDGARQQRLASARGAVPSPPPSSQIRQSGTTVTHPQRRVTGHGQEDPARRQHTHGARTRIEDTVLYDAAVQGRLHTVRESHGRRTQSAFHSP
jgi:hypothetical protein